MFAARNVAVCLRSYIPTRLKDGDDGVTKACLPMATVGTFVEHYRRREHEDGLGALAWRRLRQRPSIVKLLTFRTTAKASFRTDMEQRESANSFNEALAKEHERTLAGKYAYRPDPLRPGDWHRRRLRVRQGEMIPERVHPLKTAPHYRRLMGQWPWHLECCIVIVELYRHPNRSRAMYHACCFRWGRASQKVPLPATVMRLAQLPAIETIRELDRDCVVRLFYGSSNGWMTKAILRGAMKLRTA